MTIAELILQETAALGPFPWSGGTIHRVDAATAAHEAEEIAKAYDAWGTEVCLQCAIIRKEGRFDPNALDPNLQHAPGANALLHIGGKWPDQHTADQHSDFGIAQVNGDSSYMGPDAIGRSLEFLCRKVNADIQFFALRGYPIEVALHAYNTGRHGAQMLYDQELAAGGAWAALHAMDYGRGVMANYHEYVKLGVV